ARSHRPSARSPQVAGSGTSDQQHGSSACGSNEAAAEEVNGNAIAKDSNSGDGARTITAEAIATLVSGELIGDAGAAVKGVAPLDRAEASDLSILSSGK